MSRYMVTVDGTPVELADSLSASSFVSVLGSAFQEVEEYAVVGIQEFKPFYAERFTRSNLEGTVYDDGNDRHCWLEDSNTSSSVSIDIEDLDSVILWLLHVRAYFKQ